jgi:anti-sigma regulatory factor (Ser/Thr protein kinase)
MSTTRPYPAGDCGPEPEGAAATAGASGAGAAGAVGNASGAATATGAGGTGQPGQGGQLGQTDEAGNSSQADDAGPARAEGGAGESRGGLNGQAQPMRQVRRLRLLGASGAVPRARDFVRQALTDWGWLPAVSGDQRAAAEDVLLVVSELVTNACLHADGPEELRVGSGPKILRLEIVDQGSGSPSPRQPHRAGRPGGHGMFIVQRLCLDWGVVRNPEGTGKTVWAELAAPG